MDPRDTARRWLADVLHDADPCPCRCTGEAVCRWTQMYAELADAILNAPGVKVTEQYGAMFEETFGHIAGRRRATHTQVVVRLPAQPIGDAP